MSHCQHITTAVRHLEELNESSVAQGGMWSLYDDEFCRQTVARTSYGLQRRGLVETVGNESADNNDLHDGSSHIFDGQIILGEVAWAIRAVS